MIESFQKLLSNKMFLCVRETLSTLSTHPKINQSNGKETVVFLKGFIDAWKIISVHKLGDDKRLRDLLHSH